jgi:hypothetical protein
MTLATYIALEDRDDDVRCIKVEHASLIEETPLKYRTCVVRPQSMHSATGWHPPLKTAATKMMTL